MQGNPVRRSAPAVPRKGGGRARGLDQGRGDRGSIRRTKKTRRSLFGLALPSIRLFGAGNDDAEEQAFTEITSTVASAGAVANNRVEIRLADDADAVWRTTDPMNFPPRAGAAIRIRKGTMGTYFITVEGRTYRGARLR